MITCESIEPHFISIFDEIRNFFDIYKKLEGISVEEKEVEGSEKAKEVITHCIELYESGLI